MTDYDTRALRLLVEIVEHGSSDCEGECFYCAPWQGIGGYGTETHLPDCLYVRAKELLKSAVVEFKESIHDYD